jgi:S-adenosylmethionine:tRNA ribosyltransferase-isomerase
MTTDYMLDLSKYIYNLPDERIARFPVEPRDSSKLLLYQNQQISQTQFSKLSDYLPQNTFLVFNNTKVIPARLFFQKATGAVIEIFLLNPILPSTVISQVMEATETCTWACMIGNKKKWKGEVLNSKFWIQDSEIELKAELINTEQNLIKLSWIQSPSPSGEGFKVRLSFSELVKHFGEIPLPPYLNRKTEQKDYETYQTVYSKHDGAVAAPTAGLHFTEKVFADLAQKGIKHDFITLHVGAGTFQPIKVTNVVEHKMHSEQIVFSRVFIENLLVNHQFVIPVGTTSMRSLESLYWFGVKISRQFSAGSSQSIASIPFFIEKLYAYNSDNKSPLLEGEGWGEVSLEDSLKAILIYMDFLKIETLVGETEIFIFPSYKFRICKGIITNFHQPESTLILLIAALVGDDWQKIYDFALQNDFRFLSYGDSSLLIP